MSFINIQNKKGQATVRRKDGKAIWFVVHHGDLWDIDNRLIGFYDKRQWDPLNVNDYVIYYRAGWKKIMGILQITKKGVKINPDFYAEGIASDIIYQCRLKMVSDKVRCYQPTTERALSFHSRWVANRYGLSKQVFEADYDDLKLIISDPENLI